MGMFRVLGLVMLVARGAVAQPVLDVNAVPNLNTAAKASYANFLLINLPRAFAVSPSGTYGWQGGDGTIETARAKALASCAAKDAPGCVLYAENLEVVFQGRAAQVPPPPGPLSSTWNYSVVPDVRYFWRGPAAAAGVYVFGHGLGNLNGQGARADARGSQPAGYVRAFNNAGFDVVRFDRDPNADGDRDRAAGWLKDTLTDLRQRGYRRVIVGGQSRGAWNSLQMLAYPGLADAVIAVSAAAHGQGGSTNLTAQYDDLRQMVGGVAASKTRVAFVQFQADPFAGDLAGRAMLIERLRDRVGGLLILDQPEGFSGHFGGNTALFATRYAACLLRFVTAPVPARSC